MPLRPCKVCGTPTPYGERHCGQPASRPYRGSSTAQGYGAQHRAQTEQAINAEPWCHTIGGCPYPDSGTETNRLTGGHPFTVAEMGGDRLAWSRQARIAQCMRCNSGHRPLVAEKSL